jgi:hypothetical protein
MASFQEILNQPANAEPPSALPVGTYLMIVDGQPEIAQKGKNNNYCVTFNMKPIQAQGDVDQQALHDALKEKALQDKKVKHTMWLTDDAAWRLDQFFENLGLDRSKGNRSALIGESMGKQVLVTLSHQTSDDGKQVFAQVKNTAKV